MGPFERQVEAKSQPAFDFQTAAEIDAWIKLGSKEHGSRNEFLASDEYRAAFPAIQAVFASARADFGKKGWTAVKKSGLKLGDRVVYSTGSLFGGSRTLIGELVDKNGAPSVRLDKASPIGKRNLFWHKGFVKV